MENEPARPDPPDPPPHFVVTAVMFEGALAVVAVAVGWLLGIAPAETFRADWADLGWGVAATAPLFLGLWVVVKSPWQPLRAIRRLVGEILAPLFRDAGLVDLAVIAVVAGVGEEMLFRGLIQGGLAAAIGGAPGTWIGLAVGALVFALVHPLTRTYAALAGLIGLYLGWIWIVSGNLLVPIAAHALYDFVALLVLVRHSGSAIPATAGPSSRERSKP